MYSVYGKQNTYIIIIIIVFGANRLYLTGYILVLLCGLTLYHKYNIIQYKHILLQRPGENYTRQYNIIIYLYNGYTKVTASVYLYTYDSIHTIHALYVQYNNIYSKRFVNIEPSFAISMTWLAILYYYRSEDEHKHALVNRPYCVCIIL